MSEIVANLRFRRLVEHLHQLGPRAVGHFLAELGAERMIRTAIDVKLERYSGLTSEAVAAADAEHWPPDPNTVVDGGRR